MITTKYTSTKIPVAPVVNVSLSAPGERVKTVEYPALIDTGGDFTTVPLDWLLQVDAPEVRGAYMRGLWSPQRAVALYLVDLHIANEVLPGVEVVGIPEDDIEVLEDREIVLGRNALDNLIILLDGPQRQCSILERTPLRF
jgi:hypothetical protein